MKLFEKKYSPITQRRYSFISYSPKQQIVTSKPIITAVLIITVSVCDLRFTKLEIAAQFSIQA